MKNKEHMENTKRHKCSRMRTIIAACLVVAFALVLAIPLLAQQSQSQLNAPAPVEGSADANGPSPQKGDEDAGRNSSDDVDAGYVQGEVLVTVNPEASVESINRTLASFDFVITKDISNQDLSAGFVVIALADDANVEHCATTLSLSGLKAQPNFIYTIAESGSVDSLATLPAASFDDGEGHHLQSQAAASINDPRREEQWALDSIDAYRAWSIEKCGDKGEGRVSVAVIDTGIDVDHEDLEPNIKATYLTEVRNSSGAVKREGSTQRSDADDKNGHGTHVSGIAAGVTNNGRGISGVSHNAGLVAIKATTSETGQDFTTATLADGYNWLFAQGPGGKTNAEYYNVRIVNMSVGGFQRGGLSQDSVLAQKIKEAYIGRSGDKSFPSIVSVAAAGNYGTKDDKGNVATLPFDVIPGDYEYCLTVMNLMQGAGWSPSDNVLALSGNSNYNTPGTRFKNISAPGTYILNTVIGGGYGEKSGTSMAAPCVAGIAALILSEKPDLDASQATDIIEATSRDLETQGWDERTGYGAIDAYHALQVASATLGEDITISYRDTYTLKMSYGDGTGWEANGSTDDWAWSVSDESIVDVRPDNGKKSVSVVAKKPGVAVITATLKDADGNATTGIVLNKKVTVAKLDLAKASVLVADGYEYTGNAVAPAPIVSYGGTQFEAGVDYTVSYENNVNATTASSRAQVIISGINNCTGSARASFVIAPASLAAATLGTCGSYVYTGSAITPTPSVKLDGFGMLTEGEDFDYEYSANQNVGAAAKVRVVGRGNFIGESAWTSFAITPCSLSGATVSIANQSYEGSPVTPNPKVTINGKTLTKDRDYRVLGYANNNSAGTGKVTIEGINNYSGRREVPFTIASPVRASMITVDETPIYTGGALKPHITVRDGDKLLREGTDYAVSYRNNVNAGTDVGVVEISGRGNYAGKATCRFTIKQKNLGDAKIEVPSQVYTGNLLTPAPTVTLSGYGTLARNRDYTVVYGDNMNVGTASITVIGTGNYTGSKKGSFVIAEAQSQQPDGSQGVTMYRLYNPNSGEHFYTASAKERDALSRIGWVYEGPGWTAPSSSGTPVHRLYNPNSGDHHYTPSAKERDALARIGWVYEGVGWYSDDARRVPLYRQFNPNAVVGTHNYTASRKENDALARIGWVPEGVAWYGM